MNTRYFKTTDKVAFAADLVAAGVTIGLDADGNFCTEPGTSIDWIGEITKTDGSTAVRVNVISDIEFSTEAMQASSEVFPTSPIRTFC